MTKGRRDFAFSLLAKPAKVKRQPKGQRTDPQVTGSVNASSSTLSNRFMQPEPPREYQTTSTDDLPHDAHTPSTQYGLPHSVRQDSRSPAGQERAVLTHSRDGEPSPESSSPSERQIEGEEEQRGRLNLTSTPSRRRISAYENALSTDFNKRNQGPAFKVIKKIRQPGDKSAPFAEFPNEVMIHVFSYLSPSDLLTVALVSHQFHNLVTSPHAWKAAFARFFPGQQSLQDHVSIATQAGSRHSLHSERRVFTRLTMLPSWRSEYVLRTQLLRSLSRGKPVYALASPSSSRSGISHTANASVMYNSQMFTTVNHLHATFGSGLNKRLPRFMHGADDAGTASTSDPTNGKVDAWGLSDPQSFLQFFERYPGEAQYGLGTGDIVGNPNVMDVSQPYGMIHGEGSPGGPTYYRSVEEQRGRFLAHSLAISVPELGIPQVIFETESVCSVWIAKTPSIPTMTDGLVGILAGSSSGVLTAYSIGADNRDQRFGKGEVTARWVVSPGVPIVAIAVDDNYSLQRHAQNRIWAVVLNALGEVFYLTKFPSRPPQSRPTSLSEEEREVLAWATGRSVYWNLVEPTRREARFDPYSTDEVNGSYSPRTSWHGMCLSKEQITAETREVQAFLTKRPKDFRKACTGWNMRRRMEVDFVGDDGNHAGEAVVVIETGLDQEQGAAVTRFTRCRVSQDVEVQSSPFKDLTSSPSQPPSLFGGSTVTGGSISGSSTPKSQSRLQRRSSAADSDAGQSLLEQWRCSRFSMGQLKHVQITASALDMSTFAVLTSSEDPALAMGGHSTTFISSSPASTPSDSQPATSSQLPGQRARLLAVGTKHGTVIVWNIRSAVSRSAELVNQIDPVRLIYTSSPQISSLAVSALMVVHGGNDGLVQCWDPLASNLQPIRTLNSRFSSRARRRLVQAQASPQGVGINLFAAGAICLDPDPTVLRGMVSIGTHLLYWSYSSSSTDQYKGSKRNLRRSERGSNNGGERFSGSTRANLKDYIANEKYELEQENERNRREDERRAGRYLLAESMTEEEMLAYATMLSKETLAEEYGRESHDSADLHISVTNSEIGSTATPGSSRTGAHQEVIPPANEDGLDLDVAEAIRLSAVEEALSEPTILASAQPYDVPTFDVPIKYGKNSKLTSRSLARNISGSSGPSGAQSMTDLEFALQLSLAEEQSRKELELSDDFPALLSPSSSRKSIPTGSSSKGKGKAL